MLDSNSTLAEIQAAYADGASYSHDGDASKAKTFIVACRLLLLKIPQSVSHGIGSVTMDVKQIRQELETARRWLSRRNSGARQFSFEDFRE